jgi:membrane protease YdiL (CAAX protease family)
MAGIVAVSVLGVASAAGAVVPDPVAGGTGGRVDEWMVSIGICVAAAVVVGLLWWKDVLRPGSLERRSGRDASGLPALVWFACAAIMFVAPALGQGFALQLPGRVLGPAGGVKHDGIVALAGYAGALACGAFLLYLLVARAPGAGLRMRWKDLAVGAGAFLLCLPVVLAVGIASTVVYTLVTGEAPATIAHSTLDQILEQRGNPWVFAVIAAAVVGAPAWEELTYRVFLQSAMVRALVNRGVAVVATGVLFALVHRLGPSPVPWHAIAPIMALGVGCGIAYERTGRLGVPIVMHALFNAFNTALVLLIA